MAQLATLAPDWWVGPLSRRSDFLAADALYQSTFDYSAPEYRLNPYLLGALAKNGGSVIGVKTPPGELVGFAYGFTAVDARGPYHYSQSAVVHPEHQGRGIGMALKAAQRDFVVERTGASRMRWAFSPFLTRNAHFNLQKLGAAAVAYDECYYGTLGTERLIVEWTFGGDAYASTRARVPELAKNVVSRIGGEDAAVVTLDEPTTDGASWIVFPTDGADGSPEIRREIATALAACFAAGAVMCWAGRVDAARTAYLAVPRKEASHDEH